MRDYEGSPGAIPGTGAEWVVMIHSGGWTKEWRSALERWRAASAENDLDFRKAESVWVMSGDLAEDPHIRAELNALRRKAHRLNGSDSGSSRSWLLPSWHSRFAAAAAVGALVVALTFLVSSEYGVERYETTFGKPETFELRDGSRIAVNSESTVAVRYDGVRREATLEKGEAVFDVAKDPKRPFTVHARNGQVRVLGTSFSVVRDDELVTVSLFEGSAEVVTRGTRGDRRVLQAGDAIAFNDHGALVIADPATASFGRVAAWRDSERWIFEGLSVARVLREHNQHATKPIHVLDSALAQKRIDGALRHGDTEGFVADLDADDEARVEDRGPDYVLVPEAE